MLSSFKICLIRVIYFEEGCKKNWQVSDQDATIIPDDFVLKTVIF